MGLNWVVGFQAFAELLVEICVLLLIGADVLLCLAVV